ncbi:hypothetical protein HDU92_006657 [Lobulomyces angularis]|nr:hypothetical protein HDU92_006657 [Lobulomyces angularis]
MGNQIPPVKYVKINGITKLNPEYTNWQKQNGQNTTSLNNANQALPIISTMKDYQQYNNALATASVTLRPFAETTDQAFLKLQSNELSAKMGFQNNDYVDCLQNIFAKYEVPIGLVSKLFELERFDAIDFIIDDSGSMNSKTDTFLPNGRQMSRWEEAIERMKTFLEILAYVPTQLIQIKFLNRRDIITVSHTAGQHPQFFINETCALLDAVASNLPAGTTPYLKAIKESFDAGRGKKVARYFFGDGQPNAGEQAVIEKIISQRQNPNDNPVTFLSCTNRDEDVQWMKELEEVSLFCSEFDDFNDESIEVLKDQGQALPFSKGFYLIGQLVSAMNPKDLDAMDESVPFTKYMLDQLLGVDGTTEDYRHYFTNFCRAQLSRRHEGGIEKVKAKFNWEEHYYSFLNEKYNETLPCVIQFKALLAKKKANYKNNDDCCIM